MGRLRSGFLVLVAAGMVVTGCGDDDDGPSGGGAATTQAGAPGSAGAEFGGASVELRPVADGFKQPTAIAAAPGDDRLFVLERTEGTIRIIQDGELLDEPFLDVSDRLEANGPGDERGSGERGLLALVFHPDYATNGRLFVYYADLSGVSDLVEYHVSADPNRVDPDSAVVLRQFGPSRDHYGGTLTFAPDGSLWFSIGDGHERRKAPNPEEPRGKIYRFDVSTPGELAPAAGNPYAGDVAGLDDVWAVGFRNPWRMSLDPESGMVYIGDVGEADVEEIDVQPMDAGGLDYGWPVVEGSQCWNADTCDPSGTVPPVIELQHADGNCAVIGGVVYRGDAIPELDGTYFYSDYCGQFLRSFRFDDGEATDQHEWFSDLGVVTSVVLGSDGELYMTAGNQVLELVPKS
jgi:glucose/arabinose dehydrogenase